MKTIVNCTYFYIQVPEKQQGTIKALLMVDLAEIVIITQIALLYNSILKIIKHCFYHLLFIIQYVFKLFSKSQ